jgi:hypothetical protein
MVNRTPPRRHFDSTEEALLAQLRHFLDEANVGHEAAPGSLLARLRSPAHNLDCLLLLFDPSADGSAHATVSIIEDALRLWITNDLHADSQSFVKVFGRE